MRLPVLPAPWRAALLLVASGAASGAALLHHLTPGTPATWTDSPAPPFASQPAAPAPLSPLAPPEAAALPAPQHVSACAQPPEADTSWPLESEPATAGRDEAPLAALWEAAREAVQAQAPATAIVHLENLLQHAPGHGPTLQALARLHAAVGAGERARQYQHQTARAAHQTPESDAIRRVTQPDADTPARLELLDRLFPESVEVQFALGVARSDVGDWPAARQAFLRLVALAPEHADAWYNLALCEERLGRAEAALAAYRQALSLAREHPHAFIPERIPARLARLSAGGLP